MKKAWICVLFLLGWGGLAVSAQGASGETRNRPYRLSVAGKQLTLQCRKPVRQLIVWTTEGHRLVELKDIHQSRVSVELPVYRRVFFLTILFADGKTWSEKLAIR